MRVIFKPIFVMLMLFTLMIHHALASSSLLEIDDLITDNYFAPRKIKSVNQIKKVRFQGKIFAGCGKSIFNPLYQNHRFINKTRYRNLHQIINNNTAILISVNHMEIYANIVTDDAPFCSLKQDLDHATIEAYIVNVTAEQGRKVNLIYLINYH